MAVVLAAIVLLAPGYLLIRALQPRIGVSYGLSAAVTVTMFAVLSLVYAALEISWTGLTVVLGVIALVMTGALASTLGQRRRATDGHAPTWQRYVLPLALILAGALVVVPALDGMGGVGTLNGSFDAFFHHSAIAFIRDSGDAFGLTALTPMYAGDTTFYPTSFHSIAAILPFDIVQSANAVVLGSLALIPASVASLLDTVLARKENPRVRTAVIALISASSTLFISPAAMGLLMGLWPQTMSVTLLPASLAAVIILVRQLRSRQDPGRWRVIVVCLAVVAGAVIVHPVNAINLAVLAACMWLGWVAVQVSRRATRKLGLTHLAIALVAVTAAVVVVMVRTADMQLTAPGERSVLGSAAAAIFDHPRVPSVEFEPLYLTPVLALAAVGAVVGIGRRMVITTGAAIAAMVALVLIVVAFQPDSAIHAVTGPWYGAPERIAAVWLTAVVVLAGVGAVVTMPWLALRFSARPSKVITAGLAGVLILTVTTSATSDSRLRHISSLAYTNYGEQLSPYVAPREREFIETVSAQLPDDAVMLGIPADGTPAFWPLGGVSVVDPSLGSPRSVDARRVAAQAQRIGYSPLVCHSAHRLGVTHLYADDSDFPAERFLDDDAMALWEQLRHVDPDLLDEVARDDSGDYVVYALTVPCGHLGRSVVIPVRELDLNREVSGPPQSLGAQW